MQSPHTRDPYLRGELATPNSSSDVVWSSRYVCRKTRKAFVSGAAKVDTFDGLLPFPFPA